MRVLVTSTPGRGHIGPLVPVALALRAAGHDVRWACAAEACPTVASLGFPVDPAGLDVAHRRALMGDRLPEIMALPPRERRGHLFVGFFARAAAPVMAADVRPVIESFRPDLVIHETAELGVVPLAVEQGIPHVVVAFSGPPHVLPSLVDELSAWWASLGVDLPPNAALDGDLYFHPFPACFDADPSWPFERLRPEAAWPSPDSDRPDWLASFGSTRPAVYITFGTERAATEAPWPALLEATGDRDIDVLVTSGGHADVASSERLPGNVRVERFIPQAGVLERAAAVISHGGAGTTLGAAAAGVPQILIPLFADQWENADAIASIGAGVVCEEDERTVAWIGAALDRILGDGGHRRAAASAAREMADMPAAADHVLVLEATAEH